MEYMANAITIYLLSCELVSLTLGFLHPIAEDIIHMLLNPDLSHHLTIYQALTHRWLTSFVMPTEHDLPSLCKNFDPQVHFTNHEGTNHKNDRLVICCNEKDDRGQGRSSSDAKRHANHNHHNNHRSCQCHHQIIACHDRVWQDSCRWQLQRQLPMWQLCPCSCSRPYHPS